MNQNEKYTQIYRKSGDIVTGDCEYCNAKNVEVKEYDLGDGDKALGCVDEDRCKKQINYNEWG